MSDITAPTETPRDDEWTDADEAQHNQIIAQTAAAYAHCANFSTRRGLLPSDAHLVVIYDNNPYKDDPALRDKQLAWLGEAMTKRGIKLLSRSEYPRDGYTVAVVFSTGGKDDAARIVWDAWRAIIV